jgi:hypothetical protein
LKFRFSSGGEGFLGSLGVAGDLVGQGDEASVPASLGLEIFQYLLSSVVCVLDSSFSEVMSPSDTLDAIDEGDVGGVEYKVVNASCRVRGLDSSSKLAGSGPLAVDPHRVTASDGEASGKNEDALGPRDVDEAFDGGEKTPSNEDLFTLFHILDKSHNSIVISLNDDCRISSKAASMGAIIRLISWYFYVTYLALFVQSKAFIFPKILSTITAFAEEDFRTFVC